MTKPLRFTKSNHHLNPFTFFLIAKSIKKSHYSNGFLLKNDSDSVSWSCPDFVKFEEKKIMDINLVENGEQFSESTEDESRERSLSCQSLSTKEKDESFVVSEEISKENAALGWPMSDEITQVEEEKMKKHKPVVSDMEMMKERFSKLLLGEDMSGCGKGVCTALAISNAITNLCATLFGQLWRLEPLPLKNKSMWKREMECLLYVSDHIVELIPSWQTFPDGSKLEIMTCRPRSDLFMNLPALQKLDNMLLETLDSFDDREFWYVDQGILAPDLDGSASFRRPFQRQEEKWWLPVPRVPPGGLREATRKQLQHKRECTNQILKAAMAINSNTLAEMEVPEAYFSSLPKNARESLGDVLHCYITSDQFSPEYLIDCLEVSSEHQALEITNRVEESIYIWRQKTAARTKNNVEKRELFADRAKSLMLCLKQKFPGLTQTTLDVSKIQFNKDVGKSILESYSRVLESLAFNIVARIDDLLYVDDLQHSDQSSLVLCKRVALSYATPRFSPVPLISPAMSERIPSILRKAANRGFSVKKVLTEYLSSDMRGRNNGNEL